MQGVPGRMERPFHLLEGLSIRRERPRSVLAEPLDVGEPLVRWTDCTYKDQYPKACSSL